MRDWTPTPVAYPIDFSNLDKVDLKDVVERARRDILLADRLYLPNAFKLFNYQNLSMRAIYDHLVVWRQQPRGTAKCRKADSLVMLADGREVLASDLIDTTFEIPVLTNADKVTGFKDTKGSKIRAGVHTHYSSCLTPVFEKTDNHVTNAAAYATDNGIQKCYRVEAVSGETLEVTFNHPLLTTRGWIEAQDLRVGESIAVTSNTSAAGNTRLDDNVVKFLAYMLADGGTTEGNSATFSQMPGPQLDEFTQVASSLGFRVVPTRNPYTFRVTNNVTAKRNESELAAFLREYGLFGKHSRDKRVPRQIFDCPNDQIALFISRFMSCDGHATVNETLKGVRGRRGAPTIGLTLISEGMVRDIKRLTLRLGVYGRFRKSACEKSTANGMVYSWTVTGARNVIAFAENIGIFGKEAAVERAYATAKATFASRRAKQVPHPAFVWSKIKSIEYIGEHPTVAIQVPEHHTFVSEFIEHNSYDTARACLLLGLMFPGSKIVFTAPTFRQALHSLNYVDQLIEENSDSSLPLNLAYERDGQTVRGSMEAHIKLKNTTIFKALPMGDGKKIRGERADVLVFDEGFGMERVMFLDHILPFLQGHKEADSVGPKLIITTSAEYEECFAYHLLTRTIIPKIIEEDHLSDQDPDYKRKFCILDFTIADVEASGYKINWDIINIQLADATPEEKQQFLYNKWIGTKGQFFPPNLFDKCADPNVFIEHEGTEGCRYGFVVDVARQRDGDFFVIHVFKLLPDGDMHFVNTYWDKGLSAAEMAWKIHEFDRLFDPEYIVIDKGGGGLFVRDELMKSTLEFQDGTIKHIDPARFILEWNEIASLPGRRKLVFNKFADELVRSGFANQRSRGGEYIHTEDVLAHLMYDGLRQKLEMEHCPIRVPKTYDSDKSGYYHSEALIHERIRESLSQLKMLNLEIKENPDGSKEIVRTKANRVPKYVWRTSDKDAGISFCYGYILYSICNRDGMVTKSADPIIQISGNEEFNKYAGMIEAYPDQIWNPFAAKN